MRKTLLLFLSSAFSAILFAQKTALDKAADSTCKCLTAVRDKIKSSQAFDEKGQACILKSVAPFLADISKEENISLEELNKDVGEKLGNKIGYKLFATCPAFAELASQYIAGENEEATSETTGIVTDVLISDQIYLNVKDKTGKIIKLAWIEYFPGSDDYKTAPASLKGKKVTLEWKQIELYNVKQKDFITTKEITRLSLQ
jgi:hypothetical protein